MQARGVAPAIIFIDEIDAVGRIRGGAQGNDERDTTLNQMLSEMDGFGEGVGVIVMAATNRKDVLDPALIRPGRFDRIIQVGLPDLVGRVETFQVGSLHSRQNHQHDCQAIFDISRLGQGRLTETCWWTTWEQKIGHSENTDHQGIVLSKTLTNQCILSAHSFASSSRG